VPRFEEQKAVHRYSVLKKSKCGEQVERRELLFQQRGRWRAVP
jgi:hypothetical protein